MDFSDKKECVVFEGEAVPDVSVRKRKYLSVGARIAFWGICLAVFASVWMAVKIGAFASSDPWGDSAQNNGFLNTETAGASDSVTDEQDSESAAGEDSEPSGESSVEDNEESEGVLQEESDERVSSDLSRSERGDAYVIDHSGKDPDSEGILEMGFSGGRYSYSQKPVVLILHTHTDERYWDFDEKTPTDSLTKGVVSIGESIANELNLSGIPAVHCTVIHGSDGKDAYAEAAETIKDMLKIYPSIEYVIDVHRLEEMDGEGKVIKTESASGTAQIRLTVSDSGIRPRDTLSLALCMRKKLNKDGKKLCMPVIYTDSPYNSNLTPYYLKVDVGSEGNTAEEAREAAVLFAEAMAELLKK